MAKVWITNGPDGNGDFQMDYDKRMAEASVRTGDVFIRFYNFVPPCVSLGYHQKENEISAELCREAGIDITRRPTGGRAVLHKGDLVYGISVPLDDTSKGTSFHNAVYNRISLSLIEGIKTLGIDPGHSEHTLPLVEKTSDMARLCFNSSTRHEVQVQGKKVVGSAQRNFGNVVLQHGSILVTDEHLELIDLLPGMNDKKRTRIRSSLEKHTISLTKAGFDGDLKKLSAALTTGFSKFFQNPEIISEEEFTAKL